MTICQIAHLCFSPTRLSGSKFSGAGLLRGKIGFALGANKQRCMHRWRKLIALDAREGPRCVPEGRQPAELNFKRHFRYLNIYCVPVRLCDCVMKLAGCWLLLATLASLANQPENKLHNSTFLHGCSHLLRASSLLSVYSQISER